MSGLRSRVVPWPQRGMHAAAAASRGRRRRRRQQVEGGGGGGRGDPRVACGGCRKVATYSCSARSMIAYAALLTCSHSTPLAFSPAQPPTDFLTRRLHLFVLVETSSIPNRCSFNLSPPLPKVEGPAGTWRGSRSLFAPSLLSPSLLWWRLPTTTPSSMKLKMKLRTPLLRWISTLLPRNTVSLSE